MSSKKDRTGVNAFPHLRRCFGTYFALINARGKKYGCHEE
jgi:hypothetical protein